ncbi:MAG TPA: hypothetical protein PLD10_13615 [Rhodopila sp.]|nr:hypothetical protein [Rhodopila sp.]
MPKAIIRTTGSFILMHIRTGETVEMSRPTVHLCDDWVRNQVMFKQIVILADDLPDTASDAEFVEWLKESKGDADLAVASYASKFRPEAEKPPVKEPAKKG